MPTEKDHDKVIDSRASEGGRVIRQRRMPGLLQAVHHLRAGRADLAPDGDKEGWLPRPVRPQKALAGVLAACGKRPVPEAAKRRVVDEVEGAEPRV